MVDPPLHVVKFVELLSCEETVDEKDFQRHCEKHMLLENHKSAGCCFLHLADAVH